jgi:hypothetical protein
MIDGELYSKSYRWYRIPLDGSYRDRFYIHPETGILCAVKKVPRKQKQKQQQTDLVIVDDYHQYHKLNEIWYLISFEDFPPSPTDYVRDVLKGVIHRSAIRGRKIYAARKRQCNKKEIRFILNQLSQN